MPHSLQCTVKFAHWDFCWAHRRWGETKGSPAASVRPSSVRPWRYKYLNNSVLRASISIKLGGKSGYAKLHILPNNKVTLRSKVTGRGQWTLEAKVKFLGRVLIMAHNFWSTGLLATKLRWLMSLGELKVSTRSKVTDRGQRTFRSKSQVLGRVLIVAH